MTHSAAIWRLENNVTVDRGQHGDGGVAAAGADTAAQTLAAIQDSYEAAKGNIVDPFPETEKIDLRTVNRPAVPGALPGTESMSVAARYLAQQSVRGQAPSPASDPPSPHRWRWWRFIRTGGHEALPEERQGR